MQAIIDLTEENPEDTHISFIDMDDVSITIGDVSFNISTDLSYFLFRKYIYFMMKVGNETIEETCKRVIGIHDEGQD